MPDPKPTFFATPAKFRQWLEKNHNKASELWVGFHKKASGKKSVTYKEALDEALCFGWIDGVRKSIDQDSYRQRFSPRRAKSIWSVINTRRINKLIKLGRVATPGLEAFTKRDPERTKLYSFENRPRSLAPPLEKRFRSNKIAWDFFQQQPPGYKKIMIFLVMEAKQEETRVRRLDQLISASERRTRVGPVTGGKKA